MTVIVTGTSSGIGREAVRHLARKVHVVATARNQDDIQDLEGPNVEVASLDVTDDASMRQLVGGVLERHGAIDALVNNAGHGMFLPVEETPLDRLRAMYEVNVFGLHRMTQLVLPSMREARRGRIVNVGSIAGHIGFPMIGHYSGTKFAVRGMSQALRAEVRPFGIHVSLVEPGSIATSFGARARREHDVGRPATSAYAGLYGRFEGLVHAKGRAHPKAVAKRIVHACTAKRPRFHYLAPYDAKAGNLAKRLLPDGVINAGLSAAFRPK